MIEKSPQYAESKELLEFMHEIVYSNDDLKKLYTHDGYDLWHAFSQKIFRDILQYKKTEMFESHSRAVPAYIKDFVIGLFLLVNSSLAFVFSYFKKSAVLVYGVDKINSPYRSDFRMEELYKVLQVKKSYVEIFHTVQGRQSISNSFSRRRPAYYLEAFDFLFTVLRKLRVLSITDQCIIKDIPIDSLPDNDTLFVRHILRAYLLEKDAFVFKTALLSRLFKKSSLKTVFAIDDARYHNEVLFAAKSAGLKTYLLQHGHYTKYQLGWIHNKYSTHVITPDTIIVWSEYWKEELLRLGAIFPKDSIMVGGSKKIENISITPRSTEDPVHILIPYETACPKDEVAQYIRTLLECNRIQVTMKLRPDIDEERQLHEYGLHKGFHSRFNTTTDLKGCIDEISLVIGVYSTLLYDLIAYEKPIAILDTSSDYGEGMLINNLAELVNFDGNICGRVQTLSNTKATIKTARKNKLFGVKPNSLLKTITTIFEEEGV